MKYMGKKLTLSAISAACAAIALMTSASAFAANEHASVSASRSGVNVQTRSGHGLAITISGPDGLIIQQTFGAGEDGNLRGGGNLPDGYYNYEIHPVPKKQANNAVSAANAGSGKTDANGRSVSARPARISNRTIQTEGFRISGGSQVDTTITEE